MENRRNSKDFKIILIGVLESGDLKAFPEGILDDMKKIISEASWGVSKFYLKNLHGIYIKYFPEILTFKPEFEDQLRLEDDDISSEESLNEANEEILEHITEESILEDVKESLNYEEIIEENQKLSSDLSESRAAFDFMSMQYEDLQSQFEEYKKEENKQLLVKLFREFNSLESNKILDAFYIAKRTITELKEAGWKPSAPKLKSALFIFDLFSEFFKKKKLTTKYDLDDEIEITHDNINNFEYKGTEIIEGMKVLTKIISPAWYLGDSLISKAQVVEINKRDE
jgi:hypothetical protein